LTITLSATREGPEARAVQSQLKTVLQAALSRARQSAQPGAIEVHTGRFSVQPRMGRDGKTSTWWGQAELVLQGTDVDRVSDTAGDLGALPGLAVVQVQWGLTRAQYQQAHEQAQAQAIAQFRQQAQRIAQGFGFAGYRLAEVQVGDGQQPPSYPQQRLMAAPTAMMAADAPLPVQAGVTEVQVTVSGSVELH
jgi:predicted secreted protein